MPAFPDDALPHKILSAWGLDVNLLQKNDAGRMPALPDGYCYFLNYVLYVGVDGALSKFLS